MKEEKQKNRTGWFTVLSMVILAVGFAITAWRVYQVGILPIRWLAVIGANIILVEILLFCLRKRKIGSVVLGILALILAAVFGILFFTVGRVDQTLQEVS